MKSAPFVQALPRSCRLAGRWLAGSAAMLVIAAPLRAEVPSAIAHQGRIAVTGVNFEGDGQFKFLLFADADADHASGNETPVWSNASTTPAAMTEPASAVTVAVTKGLYGTWLGDTTIANMAALPASVEPPADTRLYLRVWFGDSVAPFVALAPDQAIAAVPFALSAASVTQGGVTADALADGAVTAAKIAPGAFTDAVIEDGSITAEKLAPGAVTGIGVPGEPGSVSAGVLLVPRGSQTPSIDSPQSVAVSGNFAYAVGSVNGNPLSGVLQIFDISNPDNIVVGDFDTTGLEFPSSVAVSGNHAYVVDIRTNRLHIFDVSNPLTIQPKGSISTGADSRPISVAVAGDFAYVVSEDADTFQIFDISDPINIIARDSDTTGLNDPRSIVVSGDFAYVASLFSGLQIFDVSNPDNIVPRDLINIGFEDLPISVAVAGNFAYVVYAASDRLQIFDVSNPDNIVARGGDTTGLSAPMSVAVAGNFAYVVNEASGNIQVFDVSNPDNIVAQDFASVSPGTPQEVAVAGNFAYVVSSSFPSSKLQIFESVPATASAGGLILNDDLNINGGSVTASGASFSGAVSTGSVSTGSLSATSVTSGFFKFTTPKSFALSIPGNAMLAQSPPDAYFRSTIGFIRPSGVSTSFSGVAPVQLPQGATITGMDIIYYDDSVGNSFTNLTTRLRRLDMFSTSGSPEQNIIALDVPSPSSPNSTTLVREINNSPDASRNVVNNFTYQYFVTVGATVTAPDADLRFYGFRIRYTLSTLAP